MSPPGQSALDSKQQAKPEQSSIDLNNKLGTRVADYNVISRNFVVALTDVASRFQIPMGIEWVNQVNGGSKVSLSWQGSTVREILDTVVKTQPDYEMVERDGVVRITCPKLVLNRENYLRLKLYQFKVDEVPLPVALLRLHNLASALIYTQEAQGGYGGTLLSKIA